MTPRRIGLLLLFAFVVGCGPGARDKALRGSLLATDAAAAAFATYNRTHQNEIADQAPTTEEGEAQLNAWHQQRAPVLDSIRVAYRLIAAATLDKDASLTDVLATVEALVGAVEQLTGKATTPDEKGTP